MIKPASTSTKASLEVKLLGFQFQKIVVKNEGCCYSVLTNLVISLNIF